MNQPLTIEMLSLASLADGSRILVTFGFRVVSPLMCWPPTETRKATEKQQITTGTSLASIPNDLVSFF